HQVYFICIYPRNIQNPIPFPKKRVGFVINLRIEQAKLLVCSILSSCDSLLKKEIRKKYCSLS
ncbi:hypothetical protein, partial [Thermoactinomyces sp. CICC 10521]|uniref:hypothetical protein n=1 Tax=Thermoactinomyces sp. CICC 10521 TaxID=2767426 RepID=UPI001E3E2AD8